jgi:hypothetical protein
MLTEYDPVACRAEVAHAPKGSPFFEHLTAAGTVVQFERTCQAGAPQEASRSDSRAPGLVLRVILASNVEAPLGSGSSHGAPATPGPC